MKKAIYNQSYDENKNITNEIISPLCDFRMPDDDKFLIILIIDIPATTKIINIKIYMS
jgi:hypothetical protein